MKKIIIYLFLLTLHFQIIAQSASIYGKVTDKETGEELVGTTVVIQGSTKGTITNFDGDYLMEKIVPGSYNIIYSFISYDKQIYKINLKEGDQVKIDIQLESATVNINEIKVTARRRTNTEMSLLTSIKASELIVNGISAQQIAKSQDKNAAEVIRRVPGITINDGRFVIVRGLIDRYNSVLLNNSSAPSFEADKKGFSFDAMPSGMIDNILIYKSPAPELPADFAGAAINIITKNEADQNSFQVSYSSGYSIGATLNPNYYTYEGGKYDWLGIDDGTRKLPESYTTTEQFNRLYTWEDLNDYNKKTDSITLVSKELKNIWVPASKVPLPDNTLSINLQRRFVIGNVTFGNITSLNYKNSVNYYELARKEYNSYVVERDTALLNFDFIDKKSKETVELGAIHNWNIIYGNNQKIEFRNFFNNMGESSTILREGNDYYDVETVKAHNLRYNQRTLYSGQLAGENKFYNDNFKINWVAGYTTTINSKPDDRRLFFVLDNNLNSYYVELQNQPTNVKNGGRLFQHLNERIYNGGLNLEYKFVPFKNSLTWVIKTGGLYENKYRTYTARLLGLIVPRPENNLNFYLPVEELITADNFYFDQTNFKLAGLAYNDGSNINNNYSASSIITSGYLSIKIPIIKQFDIYTGARVESMSRLLTDFYEKNAASDTLNLDIKHDTLNLFPSINFTYHINDNNLLRLSYGKTINRPEFREVSISVFEDFDLNALVHGNENLTDAYIDNYDIRYEWYPTSGEVVSIAGFYKKFKNPIEMFQIYSGTGYDYKPYNTSAADSKGLELDIRKSMFFLEESSSLLKHLKNITLVFNTSLIRSQIITDNVFSREKKRIMQGQSPFIINLGMFYKSEKGLLVNIDYNRIGKRIAYVGNVNNPDTWELPRNSLDFTITQEIGERFQLKFGWKDILNEYVRLVQYYEDNEEVILDTYKYRPNSKISFGITWKI